VYSGSWGEQYTSFVVGGQEMNLLVTTQQELLGVNGALCETCNTQNKYDVGDSENPHGHIIVND